MKYLPLEEVCTVLRSKNAGPFLLTLDLIVRDREVYDAMVAAESITSEKVADQYRISVDDIVNLEFKRDLNAVKITIKRQTTSGSPGDRDCYGMNQEGPLLGLLVPTG